MTTSHRCPQCDAEIPPSSPAGLCPRCLLRAANDSQSVEVSGPGPTVLTPPESGFAPPTPEELAPLFPQLEIQELLGKGGMGAVYKARQPGLDRIVAVKILPSEISHDPKFIERFQREARALAKLNHPHIVTVYDFGQTGGLCYIVMEFVDGANLRQVIRKQTLTAAEALTIVPQICEALQFAHDEGVVHRDIKPENVLIDKRGRVKIADFGLAKLLGPEGSDHSLTATQQVMGTLRYMAPEQMQGARAVDHRADIYSLGVVFYELLTGELPMGKFAPPSKKVEIDVRLDEVVLRALEQEPEQRYQHASDVKTDIESISDSPRLGHMGSPVDGTRNDRQVSNREADGFLRTVSPGIRRQLRGPAIALMLYGLLIFGPVVLLFFNGLDIADGNDGTAAPVGFALMAFSVLLVGMAGLVLRGAWHLLAVENYRGAWLGCFLAQPVGLWGLFVLSRPEVKAAFSVPALADSHEPRLSPHALWGAVWAGAGLMAMTLVVMAFGMTTVEKVVVTTSETAVVPGPPGADSPQTMMLVLLPITLLALSAPIGATTLGAVAVGRIKRAQGKLYGLRLAFVDVVCYPLGLLGLITFGLTHLLQIVIWNLVQRRSIDSPWNVIVEGGSARPDVLFLILDALVMIAVCLYVGMITWRKISGEPRSAEKSPQPVTAFIGTPVTQIRFTVSDEQDVARNARFHFSTLGYQLIEQQSDACVFQRGNKWAGLWETDIRGMHTQLTVRTAPASAGLMWVSCDWSVRTWGGWVTRRDVAKLEAEGHGLESLINGHTAPTTAPGGIETPTNPVPRPRLVPFIAALNLMAAVVLLLVTATDQPLAVMGSVPRLWRVWEAIDAMLGFTLAAGLFAASIGLFLWKPWARRVTLAVCVFGLASFVFDAPYLARFVLPEFYAEVQRTLAAEGATPEMQELGAMSTVVGFLVVPMVLGLVWLIGQLIYFMRPRVVAALTTPNENPSRLVEWLFSGTGAVVGVFSVFGPLMLLLGLSAWFENPSTPSAMTKDAVPPLGTITSGIGAEFTVPAGQVAVFEVVTRRDNETVPVPPHCGYVMASPDKDVHGTFRWSRQPNAVADRKKATNWSLEILTDGAGQGLSEATLLPEELNAAVGSMSLALGVLVPNEEVIHWGSADVNNLPADGLIGLRVTVVPHGMPSAGMGNAHIDWKKAQSARSTSRRKLSVGVP